jgi:hypothetical protein
MKLDLQSLFWLHVSSCSHWLEHKVRTYKEYHSACPLSELGLSQPLSRQRVFPSPQKQGGGGTLACGWGVGGSPNSDEEHTLWYSLYVRTLWAGIGPRTHPIPNSRIWLIYEGAIGQPR